MEFGSIADIAFAEKTSNAARTSKCVKFHDPGLPIGNQHFRLFKITLKMLKGGF